MIMKKEGRKLIQENRYTDAIDDLLVKFLDD